MKHYTATVYLNNKVINPQIISLKGKVILDENDKEYKQSIVADFKGILHPLLFKSNPINQTLALFLVTISSLFIKNLLLSA